MKSIRYLFLTALMWVLLSSASAADNLQSSRSAGKLRQDQSVDISRQLRLSEPLARHRTGQAENYAARSKGQVETYVANRHDRQR